jgi:hypothetical protein
LVVSFAWAVPRGVSTVGVGGSASAAGEMRAPWFPCPPALLERSLHLDDIFIMTTIKLGFVFSLSFNRFNESDKTVNLIRMAKEQF